jgi:hypothetical protein
MKELFHKLSCVEDIVIFETMFGCNVVEYNLVRYMSSYCMRIFEY